MRCKMQTIYRVRSVKNRTGISNGPVFIGFHFLKRSFYFEKPNALKEIKVSVRDTQGTEEINEGWHQVNA